MIGYVLLALLTVLVVILVIALVVSARRHAAELDRRADREEALTRENMRLRTLVAQGREKKPGVGRRAAPEPVEIRAAVFGEADDLILSPLSVMSPLNPLNPLNALSTLQVTAPAPEPTRHETAHNHGHSAPEVSHSHHDTTSSSTPDTSSVSSTDSSSTSSGGGDW